MTVNTKVVNLSRKHSYDVYIGRPTVFGNPFVIGRDGNRDDVCDKYFVYLRNKCRTDDVFLEKVLALRGKRLGCYCAPLRCHGDEIIKFHEWWSASRHGE